MDRVLVIGGGLAGCEAALAAARLGVEVELVEMRPVQKTPAHQTDKLAELVCSNSLRAEDTGSAVGLLKAEMAVLGSIVIEAACETRVPAGKALAVDRDAFAEYITAAVEEHPLVTPTRREVTAIPEHRPTVIATGPLTSDALAENLIRLTGRESLHFYDAIAPIIDADSIDYDVAFRASRYEDGQGDYLNCPLTEAQYDSFYEALMAADQVPARDFEDPKYFEGCLPIEVMAVRGKKTLTFGPMKPVGLTDPRTGKRPFAVVQLRQEDFSGRFYNMVGFQTKLTYPAQEKVFRMIPGLERAEFVRLGSVHRNTFLEGPELIETSLELKGHPGLYVAGQLSGVEGYVESAAMGILAGINAAGFVNGQTAAVPPPEMALGALVSHLTVDKGRPFQPSNVNFGLFPPLERRLPKRQRGAAYADRALAALADWLFESDDPA